MIGTDIEQQVLSTLFVLKLLLKNTTCVEYSFLELFGREYLDRFDEYDSELEKLIISFCSNHHIHCTKTKISYIFSNEDLKFKRKFDQKLC